MSENYSSAQPDGLPLDQQADQPFGQQASPRFVQQDGAFAANAESRSSQTTSTPHSPDNRVFYRDNPADRQILNLECVKTLLIQVLEKITGLPPGRVIREGNGETGPRPDSGLYCSLYWESLEPLPQNGGEHIFPQSENEDAPIQILRHESLCEVQISFWGPKAFEAAVQAVQALQTDDRWFDLWRVLGYSGVDCVKDASAPFNAAVQGRCYFNLSFYACFGAEYPVEWFDASAWNIPRAGRHEPFDYSKEIADEPKSHCVS